MEIIDQNKEFICALCQGTFHMGRTDDEAIKEREGLFPGENDWALTCEDCFIVIMERAETSGLQKSDDWRKYLG